MLAVAISNFKNFIFWSRYRNRVQFDVNLEILDAVIKLKIPRFRGVFVRDKLPLEPKRMEYGVLNLDDTSGNGTHWVAWYRDNGKKYYFDSYGVQPPGA